MSPAGLPRTTDGAIAFMQFWFDAVEYAYATGDTTVVEANSTPGCSTCHSLTTHIDQQYGSGGSFRGVHATLSNVVAAPLEPVMAPISLQVVEASSQQLGADGAVQSETPAQEAVNTTFYAAWMNSRWVTAEVVRDRQ